MDSARSPVTWHARAPARIDFGGGWTDVPDYAGKEGGIVVNAAVNCYVRVDVIPGGKGIRLQAQDISARVHYPSASAIAYDGELDLHKAALNMFPVMGGLELVSHSDLPHGSGLGGSGALDVALVSALVRARGEWYDRTEVAELGFQLEAVELKLKGGRQDQYAAALGGFHQFSFQEHAVTSRPLDLSPEQAADLLRHLVLVYSGESHFSSSTHNRVWEAYAEGKAEVIDALHAIKDIGAAIARPIETADWRELARLMDENWRQQQRLDETIATTVTGNIESAARAAGAWGVKATGAGSGGCLVILGPPECREAIIGAAGRQGASLLEVEFDFEGVTTWEEGDADGDGG